MRKKITPEGQLTQSVKSLLRAAGIFHWKVWQGMGSAPGVSDIVGCHNGRFFAIELKAPKGTATPDQIRFIENVKGAGGIAFVAKSLDEVIDGLGLQDRFLIRLT
jgi:hypothetical protein